MPHWEPKKTVRTCEFETTYRPKNHGHYEAPPLQMAETTE